MKRSVLIAPIAIALLFILALPVAAAAAKQGAATITIFGGSRGKVPFPHAQHQARLKDCNICHSTFPQEVDAMRKMKENGTLKPKKVMNLQCIKCHKADKRAGKPHGPVTCSTCHVK
jgi:hypothetical protein